MERSLRSVVRKQAVHSEVLVVLNQSNQALNKRIQRIVDEQTPQQGIIQGDTNLDPNLTSIPFRNVDQVNLFFQDPDKIRSLYVSVLADIPWHPSSFARAAVKYCCSHYFRKRHYMPGVHT